VLKEGVHLLQKPFTGRKLAQAVREALDAPEAQPPAPRKARVLLVDDDAQVRKLTTLILERAGYLVESAGTVKAASEMLGSGHEYVAILCDMTLPDGSGEDVVRRVREAQPELRDRVAGLAEADSWTTDAHKWLNVPYDSGIVIVRDAAAHHAAMTLGAAYYVETVGGERDSYNWVPESSRRARGFAVYAALRSLGRAGLAEMIDRCCALARRMADGLRGADGVTILNDVVLNQVLVRFEPPGGGDADAFTRAVIVAVQADGTCWLGGTTWHGMAAMRISVSNWSTTEADADMSVEAILRSARMTAGAPTVTTA